MTTLRQRMIDAMDLRGFRPRTQVSYLRAVSLMARHYHRSPELITDQEVQAYSLHLVRDRQLALTGVNQVSSATRFLICEVLGQADRRSRIPMALTPQRLPEVLSRAEVAAVLAAPISLPSATPAASETYIAQHPARQRTSGGLVHRRLSAAATSARSPQHRAAADKRFPMAGTHERQVQRRPLSL